MICTKARCRVEVHLADRASILCLTTRAAPAAAVHTVTYHAAILGPMANKGLVYNCWGCRLYMGDWGGIGSGYLCQELLAEGQQAWLSAVVETPQLVGVTNAHIE